MKNVLKSIISIVLVISMFICATVPAFAVSGEEYICELRLIYAEDYDEAKEILEDSEFSDYELFDENLNADTDEIGVWLAYKTTTDIEDAITDLSVMQMNGGYQEGNFQEMIKQSYEEYVAMGEIYKTAIDYFMDAYKAGHFLSESAYRQLNFYTVVSEGIPEDEIPDFEGELLGDIFSDGISEGELATMFMQGNVYALKNIRSLIAMGVSYNADGKTYLDKVGAEAAKMTADTKVYDGKKYDALAEMVALSISTIRDALENLSAYESELNYEDDVVSESEVRFVEINTIANMLRDVDYLNGKSLYDFFMEYDLNSKDRSSLYPLVAALNEGQMAMTTVAHYYDVIRYCVPVLDESIIKDELDRLEEIYIEEPFNVYAGVDRTIYYGTFALTSEADRADAYNESGVTEALFGAKEKNVINASVFTGLTSLSLFACAGFSHYVDYSIAVSQAMKNAANSVSTVAGGHGATYGDVINQYFTQYLPNTDATALSFSDKVTMLQGTSIEDEFAAGYIERVSNEIGFAQQDAITTTTPANVSISGMTGMLYIGGGILMLYTAYKLTTTLYNFYHPDYDDIPIAMVDLIDTIDGDRYIKYDVVFEAEAKEDGEYAPADLNAFEAHRWNALYYTKSYEAGKPLLADEFSLSNTNNKPKANYTPVHRFGEVVCYDLNKYNFDYDDSIYLSVKQSKNEKSAVADVPEVIGSMFGAGFLFLAGGIGAAVGVGGTLGTLGIIKKRKAKAKDKAEA